MAPSGFVRSVAAGGALFFTLVCAAGAAESVELGALREDVRQMLMMMDGVRDRSCTERKVVNAEVLEARPDGAPSVERWTLDRCGKLVNYRVRFFPNAKGATDFDIQLEAPSPLPSPSGRGRG